MPVHVGEVAFGEIVRFGRKAHYSVAVQVGAERVERGHQPIEADVAFAAINQIGPLDVVLDDATAALGEVLDLPGQNHALPSRAALRFRDEDGARALLGIFDQRLPVFRQYERGGKTGAQGLSPIAIERAREQRFVGEPGPAVEINRGLALHHHAANPAGIEAKYGDEFVQVAIGRDRRAEISQQLHHAAQNVRRFDMVALQPAEQRAVGLHGFLQAAECDAASARPSPPNARSAQSLSP